MPRHGDSDRAGRTRVGEAGKEKSRGPVIQNNIRDRNHI